MKAAEVAFQQLLNGQVQYRVPLFQRTYSWQEENWQRLWDDLLEVYALATPRSHFIGAVVTLPIPDSPERASKFMLIDGQQRLTTLFLLLAVIRDAAQHAGLTELAAQIQEECLINKFAGSAEERQKMRPTQQDVVAFEAAVGGNVGVSGRVGEVRQFFRSVLRKGDLEAQPIELARLKLCITEYFNLVSIRLDQDDSPHRIFESLNNTGMALTASDLIRNHLFMRMPSEVEQAQAYQAHWYPMQQQLERAGDSSVLSDFFWRYLMMGGALPRYDEVYEAMRIYIDKELEDQHTTVAGILAQLHQFSQYYARLWRPQPHETVAAVRTQLERLNQWEVEVAYPFLLSALQQRQVGVIGDEQLLQVLRAIESYVVRRIICGIPTNRLRRVFARMTGEARPSDYVTSCREYLMANDWPTDDVFHEMFQAARIYVGSRLSRTRLILSSLEQSYQHREPIAMSEGITIEHIMPQSLSDEWRRDLGPSAGEIHDKYLHTIGNLTYSGYNAELGNAPFAAKRQMLQQSHFEINRRICQAEQWTEHEIRDRARELADRAVAIWKR